MVRQADGVDERMLETEKISKMGFQSLKNLDNES